MIHIRLNSIMVDDQDKALAFYTEKVGFTKKQDIPMGEFRWISVGVEGEPVELALEPNANPVGKTFQQAIYEQGIPATALESDDIQADYDRMTAAGVTFKSEPTAMGPVTLAVFDDTCGNFIQLYQQ